MHSSSEAAILKPILDDDNTQAALLVDATNAFNLVNPLRPKSHLSGSSIASRILNYNSRMLWAINLR